MADWDLVTWDSTTSNRMIITNDDLTFDSDDDDYEEPSTLQMVFSPVPDPIPSNLPPSGMQTYSSSCSLVSSEDEGDSGGGGENDEEDDESGSEFSLHKTKRIRRSALGAPSSTTLSLGTEFSSFYKRSVRLCAVECEGTFDMDYGFELQFLSKIQPIPNRLVCRFKMFGEIWLSAINYVQLPQEGEDCKDKPYSTVLEFSITHVDSQTITTVMETSKEAELRHTSVKPRTICNRVFLLALDKCHQYLAALPRSVPNRTQRLSSVSSSGKARKCTESISLFGLRSGFMKDMCEAFLAH
ncbi:hypothetical protein BASA81_005645 [Batrachochytrium salamandrivorans]|nr:hypothetical protein BASA81_005645 [Batrachochytrium salamandrivorans]